MTAVITAAVSFLVACLCGMGAGGGGLMVLYLTLALHLSQRTAQGINLLFFLSASAGTLLINIKNGRLDPKRIGIIILFGIPLALLGSYCASKIETGLLRKLYGGFLAMSGGYFLIMALKKK